MTASPRTTRALTLIAAALAVGAVTRTLLVTVPLRLNIALAGAALAIAIAALAASGTVELRRQLRWLAIPGALLLGGMIWRDSPALFALDMLAFWVLLLVVHPSVSVPRLTRAGTGDLVRAGIHGGVMAATGPLWLMLREISWGELPAGRSFDLGRRIVTGMAVAVPGLVVFGSLFRSADPAYDAALSRLVVIDIGPTLEHALVAGFIAWWVAGYFYGAFIAPRPPAWPGSRGTLGAVELTTALGALAVLFASFVVFQAGYLFGGEAVVQATGTTYAEYARRGFFELVWAVALALPLLLVADWALRPEDRHARRRLRALQAIFVVLLFVLLASALDRMRLYTTTYGLTELRLYTSAFMAWLALVIGWYAATVLRGRRRRFAFGALASAFLLLGVLHVVNPDALIVRTNAARLAAGGDFDASYAAGLSADAAPALLEVAGRLPAEHRCAIAHGMTRRLVTGPDADEEWTISRARARRLLAAEGDRLSAGCSPPRAVSS